MRILGISRGTEYSPNLAGNDAAIFTAVADELRGMGHIVSCIGENEMVGFDYTPYERVVTMARDVFSLVMLEKETDTATQQKFINSINGILTCTNKAKVATLMLEEGVPQPEFLVGEHRNVLFCSAGSKDEIVKPLWLKNCEGSATVAEDTVFCPTKESFDAAFRHLEERDVSLWMVQEHQEGDLVKFYGVEGTDFFRWNYASKGHSKFGLEAVNGKEKGFPFDAQRIKRYADMVAKRLHVPIYGGDVIIDEKGGFWFIDFNDFPSFSSCREEAAKAIAQRIDQSDNL
jgi:glutathione synthase/RimK-type ligase-like ATP-grasp enzyme